MQTGRTRRAAWASAGIVSLGLLAAACGSAPSPAPTPAPTTVSPAPGAASAVIKTQHTSLGMVLANASGFTLYSFARDTPMSSACAGACAAAWPPAFGTPHTASGVSLPGKLSTISRVHGTLQASYNGHPLYTYRGDTAPGQTSGNGLNAFGGLWRAVTPSGSAKTPAPSPSPTGKGGYGY